MKALGMASNKKNKEALREALSALEKSVRDFKTLSNAIDTLSCYMYSSENDENESLEYFREREWRVTDEFIKTSTQKALCEELSEEQKNYLVKINPSYFEAPRTMKKQEEKREVDFCKVIKEINGENIFEVCTRIIVPEEKLSEAKNVYKIYESKIVPLSSL